MCGNVPFLFICLYVVSKWDPWDPVSTRQSVPGGQRQAVSAKLNAVTKPDLFPLPRIEDCIDEVCAAKLVTKLDLL